MKALLVIYGPTDGIELLRAAQALRSRGIDIAVHVVGHADVILDRIGPSQSEGIMLSDIRGPVALNAQHTEFAPDAAAARPFIGRLLGRAFRYVRYRVGLQLSATLPGEVFNLWTDRAACRRVLVSQKPDILILPLESVGHHSATMAEAAYRRGIPVLVLPYTVPVNVPELAERFYFDRTYWLNQFANRLIGWILPQWITVYRGRPLLRLRAREIVARWLLGLMPERPWDAGGLRYAGAIAIENDAMMAFYRRERFPQGKLQRTGAITDDLLAMMLERRDDLKAKLYQRLSLDPQKLLLVCGFPPDFTLREQCDFKDFAELRRFWLATLAGLQRFNVVIRPHPSLLPSDLAGFQSDNIRVVKDDTASLLPLCDVYVASVSSTIRWAIACGIPVINYDVFRFRYRDFNDAAGVVRLEERDAFVATLKRIDEEPDYLARLSCAQQSCRHQWGHLDGRSTERLAALIEHLVRQPRLEPFAGRIQGVAA